MRHGSHVRYPLFTPASALVASLVAAGAFGCSFVTSLTGLSDDYGKGDAALDGSVTPPDRDGARDDTGSGTTGGGTGGDADTGAAFDGGPKGAETLADNQKEPMGLTVTDAEIYWVTVGDASFWRAPKSGGAGTKVVVEATVPFDVAIEGSFMYWTEAANVYRQQVNTNNRQYLFTGDARAAYLTVMAGTVYFTDYRGDRPGSVQKNNGTLFGAQGLSAGVANVGNTIVWAHGPAGSFSVIDEADTAPEAGSPTATNLFTTTTFVQGLAADSKAVYWMEAGKRIMRGDRATKRVTTLYDGADFTEGDVAVDARYVYWTERGLGRVRRLALSP